MNSAIIAPPAVTPEPGTISPPKGGIQFRDAAPFICGVVDNGVCSDDPRVLTRLNEATKIILDNIYPVGGMATALVAAVDGNLMLPPELENAIEAFPADPGVVKVYGNSDITRGWYEIVNNSVYLDPAQAHDNPLIDLGLWPDPDDPSILRRMYNYPGLEPSNALIWVTGAKRYLPVQGNEDYLIVQNLEAVKCIIQSIERYENNDIQTAQVYRKEGLDLLQSETRKHLLDPRNYMRRKAGYRQDMVTFPENTLGWIRANLAIDVDDAMKTGKSDLTWHINKVEQRIMQRGTFKDCIVNVSAEVTGGMIYFPLNVGTVLAADLSGRPIPIRSQFFQYLDNGPGMFPCNDMLVDQGDEFLPGTTSMRRKYKLIANCCEGQEISTVCKLRWILKKPEDLMVIKNYEALRLMVAAKFMEDRGDVQNAQANHATAFDLLDKELRDYLGGIKHTIQIQTYGFGLGDVGQVR